MAMPPTGMLLIWVGDGRHALVYLRPAVFQHIHLAEDAHVGQLEQQHRRQRRLRWASASAPPATRPWNAWQATHQAPGDEFWGILDEMRVDQVHRTHAARTCRHQCREPVTTAVPQSAHSLPAPLSQLTDEGAEH
jgi:hypothetical protein